MDSEESSSFNQQNKEGSSPVEEPEQKKRSSQQGSLMAPSNIFKEAVGLFKDNFFLFVGIAAIPFFVSVLFSQIGNFLPSGNLPLKLVAIGVTALVTIVLGAWSQLALFYAIKEKGNLSFKQAFGKAWGNILSFWWISVLISFITAGGAILFLIPGILFGVWFSLSLMVFVSEGTKGFDALLKSKKYVEGYFGGIFWRQLFLGLVSILLILPLAIIESILLGASSEIIVNAFSTLILSPLGIIYIYLLYRNVKKIKAPLSFSTSKKQKVGFVVIGLLGLLLIGGLVVSTISSASKSKSMAADARKISTLKQVQLELNLYYSSNRKYPSSLDQLAEGDGTSDIGEDVLEDWVSEVDYEAKEGGESYEACVELKKASDQCITPDDPNVDLNF